MSTSTHPSGVSNYLLFDRVARCHGFFHGRAQSLIVGTVLAFDEDRRLSVAYTGLSGLTWFLRVLRLA
jgi:hypothetical protein